MLVPGDDQIIPIAVNLDGLEFSEPNAYSVVISIDDTDMRRLPMRVQRDSASGDATAKRRLNRWLAPQPRGLRSDIG